MKKGRMRLAKERQNDFEKETGEMRRRWRRGGGEVDREQEKEKEKEGMLKRGATVVSRVDSCIVFKADKTSLFLAHHTTFSDCMICASLALSSTQLFHS